MRAKALNCKHLNANKLLVFYVEQCYCFTMNKEQITSAVKAMEERANRENKLIQWLAALGSCFQAELKYGFEQESTWPVKQAIRNYNRGSWSDLSRP